jgi:hypothetical protein
VATHYEVLGVDHHATPQEIRRAYHDRARALHPDRAATTAAPASERAMQDVNEAWRVLGDPGRRAAYDRRLDGSRSTVRPAAGGGGFGAGGVDDDLDRPFHGRPAEPGDLALSLVRALPWLAVLFVLGVIFVFTAFAGGRSDEDPGPPSAHDLVGSCIQRARGSVIMAVPCNGPNEGRVDLVASRASICPRGTTVAPMTGNGPWLCLRQVGDEVEG